MAKRCTKCGNFMMEDERFCPSCGENSQLPPDANATVVNAAEQPQQNNGYAQQQYNNGYAQQQYNGYQQQPNNVYQQQPNNGVPYYAAPQSQPQQEEMTLKNWVLTVIVTTFFGLISIVFLFIWGFGDGPESRKRYCKAMLIAEAISLGIGIIFSILFSSVIMAIIGGIASEMPGGYDSWSSIYAAFTSIM